MNIIASLWYVLFQSDVLHNYLATKKIWVQVQKNILLLVITHAIWAEITDNATQGQ